MHGEKKFLSVCVSRTPPGNGNIITTCTRQTEDSLRVNHTACLCRWGHIDDNVTLHQSEEENVKRCLRRNNIKLYQRGRHLAICRHISYTVWQSFWEHIGKYVTARLLVVEVERLWKKSGTWRFTRQSALTVAFSSKRKIYCIISWSLHSVWSMIFLHFIN